MQEADVAWIDGLCLADAFDRVEGRPLDAMPGFGGEVIFRSGGDDATSERLPRVRVPIQHPSELRGGSAKRAADAPWSVVRRAAGQRCDAAAANHRRPCLVRRRRGTPISAQRAAKTSTCGRPGGRSRTSPRWFQCHAPPRRSHRRSRPPRTASRKRRRLAGHPIHRAVSANRMFSPAWGMPLPLRKPSRSQADNARCRQKPQRR